jgi:hypothetical protein
MALDFNPTPKSRFNAESVWVKKHREFIERDEVQLMLDFAFMEYTQKLKAESKDSAASFNKMQGAMEYIATLKTLTESIVPRRHSLGDNLNHNV